MHRADLRSCRLLLLLLQVSHSQLRQQRCGRHAALVLQQPQRPCTLLLVLGLSSGYVCAVAAFAVVSQRRQNFRFLLAVSVHDQRLRLCAWGFGVSRPRGRCCCGTSCGTCLKWRVGC